MRILGNIDKNDMASTWLHTTPAAVSIDILRANDNGYCLTSLIYMRASKKLFHVQINWKMQTEKITGFRRGRCIR
jgi:hypothetical protein